MPVWCPGLKTRVRHVSAWIDGCHTKRQGVWMLYKPSLLISALCLVACSAADPTAEFQTKLATLCGQTYMGQVVSDDAQDEDWRKEDLTLGPVRCEGSRIEMPLAVGADTSRTWVLEPKGEGLHFYHIHAHSDGIEDAVSRYGGMAVVKSGVRATFPADDFTKDLFVKEDIAVSVPNVWSFDINPGVQLAYELNRPGRHFRAEFDLSKQD